MHPVGDLVIVVPDPVLFHHGIIHRLSGSFGRNRLLTEDHVRQEWSEAGISFRRQLGTIDGHVGVGIIEPLFAGRECIDKADFILTGHFLHGPGVEQQICIFLFPVRQVVFGREILKRDR